MQVGMRKQQYRIMVKGLDLKSDTCDAGEVSELCEL